MGILFDFPRILKGISINVFVRSTKNVKKLKVLLSYLVAVFLVLLLFPWTTTIIFQIYFSWNISFFDFHIERKRKSAISIEFPGHFV